MYKMQPNYTLALNHAKKYQSEILAAIDFWLATETGGAVDVAKYKNLTLHVRVEDGKLTKWYLEYLKQSNHLESLLKADMDEILAIIKRIRQEAKTLKYDERLIFDKVSKRKYLDVYNKGKEPNVHLDVTIDHFNYIMEDVFVNHGYNLTVKSPQSVVEEFWFKKDEHIRDLHQRICPYCGRSFIYMVEHSKNSKKDVVKPQIDHYLPKSTYPWFAMTYFNLIPVCAVCNMKECKGSNDPLTNYDRKLRMIYPYEFNDRQLTFRYQLNGSHYYDEHNISVLIDYNGNTELEDGSRNVMKLDEFYKFHNHEVKTMYHQMMVLVSRAKGFYPQFNVPLGYLRPTPSVILGFPLNEKSSHMELLYKFKKDIYMQMIDGFNNLLRDMVVKKELEESSDKSDQPKECRACRLLRKILWFSKDR